MNKLTTIPNRSGIEVIRGESETVLRRRWYSHYAWLLVLVLCFLLIGNLMSKQSDLWLYAIGAIGVYYVACLLLNKTDITMSSDQISVRTHPLPWLEVASVTTLDIVAFNVRRRKGRSGGFFDLTYTRADQEERPLVRYIIKQSQAECLRAMLVEYYGFSH